MAGEDETERKTEDLFEDLDKFFAPIDEVDWPEDSSEAGVAPSEGEASAPAPSEEAEEFAASPPPPDPEWPSASDAGPDATQDVEEASAEEAAQVFLADDTPGDYGPAGDERPDAAATSPDDVEIVTSPEEPTAEMSGEDWRRLRDVLGEEEEADSFSAAGYGGSVEPETPSDLTLDDLRKAPPQYVDLPGPLEGDEESPLSAAEAAEAFMAGESAESPTQPAVTDGPQFVDVEAVAERLAEGLRSEGEMRAPEPAFDEDPFGAPAEPEPRRARVGEPGSLGGPAWEEPASRSMDVETARPPGGRDVPAAIITGGVLVAACLVALWFSKAAFVVVAGIVALIAQAELYATTQRREFQPATALGLVSGGMLVAAAYLRGEQGVLLFVVLALVLTFLWYMAAHPKARLDVTMNTAVTVFGVVYVPLLASYVAMLVSLPGGKALVLSVLGLTFLYDVSAFAVGSFIGRRPLARTISPKKSWEGLLGATAVTLLVAAAVLPSIAPFKGSGALARAVGMALVIVVFAPLGDLAESVIKRDLRVKDMGTILPGHGGVLDRIDSVLFVAPAAFYFLRLIF